MASTETFQRRGTVEGFPSALKHGPAAKNILEFGASRGVNTNLHAPAVSRMGDPNPYPVEAKPILTNARAIDTSPVRRYSSRQKKVLRNFRVQIFINLNEATL
jgi:hypothetical protein